MKVMAFNGSPRKEWNTATLLKNMLEGAMSRRAQKEYSYSQHFANNERLLKLLFGDSESLFCYDTLQFTDYSKVLSTRFDPEKKARRRQDVFPDDCRKAFEMGVRLANHE